MTKWTPFFSAREVTDSLRVAFAHDPSILQQVTRKKISNDLARLYRMQLLSRKRVKRDVITRNMMICYRGYKYHYRVSKQGLSYYSYLQKPEFDRRLAQEVRRKQITLSEPANYAIMQETGKLIGRQNGIALIRIAEYWAASFGENQFHGRYNRFPPRRDFGLFSLMLFLLFRSNDTYQANKTNLETIGSLVKKAMEYEKMLYIYFSLLERAFKALEVIHASRKVDNSLLGYLTQARNYCDSINFNPRLYVDDKLISGSLGISKNSSAPMLEVLNWLIRNYSNWQ
jgi:hypothetical protein